MKKQKDLLVQFLVSLGIAEEVDKTLPENKDKKTAKEIADGFFPDDATKEPVLDQDTILASAQSWAKPFLKDAIERELQPHYKGKYINDALGKIAAASKGLIKREDLKDKTIEEAMAMFEKVVGDKKGISDSEAQKMIEKLNESLAAKDKEKQDEIDRITKEYEGKEAVRFERDQAVDYFGKKSLKVAPNVAYQGIFPALKAKGYNPKYNADKKAWDLLDAEGKPAKASETKFAKFDEEVDGIIGEWEWKKQSKGSGSGQQGPNLPGGNNQPANGGEGGKEPEVKRSRLGGVYHEEGIDAPVETPSE